MINKIGDLALTAAYASGSQVVEIPHLRVALSELIESQSVRNISNRWSKKKARFWWWFVIGVTLCMLIGLKWYHLPKANSAWPI